MVTAPPGGSLSVDVVVIGGGHAGCEAAAAAARAGARTLLLTQHVATIGEMSCNPSFGGVGKGTLVREIDAMDGVMGRVVDNAGIQFRVLNRSKGPAVQGPRAQADRDLYKVYMRQALGAIPNLCVFEDSAEDVMVEGESWAEEARKASDAAVRVIGAYAHVSKPTGHGTQVRVPQIAGVVTGSGVHIHAKKVVITTGTFLRGMVHIGKDKYPAGRHQRDSADVEPPSVGLAKTLERLQFPMSRLTTGTPPRLDTRSINYDGLEVQPSDDPPVPFSYLNDERGVLQRDRLVCCHMTFTTKATHDVINAHRHLLPSFLGNEGKGQGPRYCPAIEKKVIRFPDKESHHIWLEPEGLTTNTVYPNGINTAFPPEVQLTMLRTIPGLEHVDMVRCEP
ncbi:tRNA uridine-5-carboxymethylaminomethyl(34) synthesis enzyme MnmG [archaeon]|nr:MAG: tRNA uridine-5-carboxymethylaminomethyl(34) synthesis enzyme MnmG [archaeon]